MQASNTKWKNRSLLPFLLWQTFIGSYFFLYDLVLVAASEPTTIKDAFDRRAEQNGNPGLRDYLKSDLTGLISNLHLPKVHSLYDLESKYDLCKEAILKFWEGDNSWEMVVDIQKQRKKDEGISWDDIAIQLRTKRHQMATAATDHLPASSTDKERNITIWVACFGPYSLLVQWGAISLNPPPPLLARSLQGIQSAYY